MDEAEDSELWTYCADRQIALISKDEDFIFLAAHPGDTGRLVWVRLGNCRNVPLLEAFDRAHDEIVFAFESDQRVVELR